MGLSLFELKTAMTAKQGYTISPQNRHLQDLKVLLNDMYTTRGSAGNTCTGHSGASYTGMLSLGDMNTALLSVKPCTCHTVQRALCDCQARTGGPICNCNLRSNVCECQARTTATAACICNTRTSTCSCQSVCVVCSCNSDGCESGENGNPVGAAYWCTAEVVGCDCQARATAVVSCQCNLNQICDCQARTTATAACICNTRTSTCSCQSVCVVCSCNSDGCSDGEGGAAYWCTANVVTCDCQARTTAAACNCNLRTGPCDCQVRTSTSACICEGRCSCNVVKEYS